MGIKGLSFFLKKKGAAITIEDLKRFGPDGKVIVVMNIIIALMEKVDGNGLLFYLFHNSCFSVGVEWIHGGQLLHFAYIVEKFILQFQKNSIKLVVIFDGNIPLIFLI